MKLTTNNQIRLPSGEIINLVIWHENTNYNWYRVLPDKIDRTNVHQIIDTILYNLGIASHIKDGNIVYKEEFVIELKCPKGYITYDSGNRVYVQRGEATPYVSYQGIKMFLPKRKYLSGYKCSQELGYTFIFTQDICGNITYPKYIYRRKLYSVLGYIEN